MYTTTHPRGRLVAALLRGRFPRPLLLHLCDWYICRVDYGRSRPLRVMYWLYVRANWYTDWAHDGNTVTPWSWLG